MLDSIVPISKADIQELLPDVSVTAIESVLAKLLKENKIYKIGTYKNAKYLKNNRYVSNHLKRLVILCFGE